MVGGIEMESSTLAKENLETLFSKLENFLKTETVVGEPIVVGETTLVPIISVTFGCGTGSGGGDSKATNSNGAGIGACARIVPNAIVVIKNDGVTLLPVQGRNNLDSILNLVPGIVSKFKKDGKKAESAVNQK